jgi:hypothetical protein
MRKKRFSVEQIVAVLKRAELDAVEMKKGASPPFD